MKNIWPALFVRFGNKGGDESGVSSSMNEIKVLLRMAITYILLHHAWSTLVFRVRINTHDYLQWCLYESRM